MNDYLDRPLRGPAIYNPDLLSKDELVRGFVARQDVLRLFIDELRRVAKGSGVQHHLLLGQRGMGKTTLLRRLRYAVDDDPALRGAWLPLIFPEEQYDVAYLSDFYLNCIDALIDALEMRGKVDAAHALEAAVAAIPDDDEATRADHALDLLVHTAKRQKARLLLLLDNIDLLFHRLADHHWTLRELLSSQDSLCVVGASAAAIETTYDYGKAFYDFFQIHTLGSLSEDECREVLLALSRMFETPQVEQWITREPGRLRALRLLTGGNPRTVTLLHTIAASGADGDVRSDLERLLDQCTALYKHRFESLSDQAQRVVHALALRWHPASAAEVAEATRLDVNAASSQLARLVADGIVEKVPFVPETKTGFQIAERFFNIWYLMRQSRRVRNRLVWLVEFLKMSYEGEELRAHARGALRGGVLRRGGDAAIRYAESALAFAEAVGEEPLRKALEGAAAHALTVVPEVRAKIAAIVDLEGVDASLKPVVDRHRAAAEIREAVLAANVDFDGWNAEEFADLLGGSTLERTWKEATVRRLDQLSGSQIRELICGLHNEISTWKPYFGPTLMEQLRRALHLGYVEGIQKLRDCDDMDAAAIAMNAPLLRALAIALRSLEHSVSIPADSLGPLLPPGEMQYGWMAYVRLLDEEGRVEEEEKALRKVIAMGHPLDELASLGLGLLLADDPHRLDEAEAALRAAVAAPMPGSLPWKALASFLEEERKNYQEAADAYQQALELNPRDAPAWNALGNLLLYHLERPADAEAAYRQATRIEDENATYWRDLGLALLELKRYSRSEWALRKAIERQAGCPIAWWLLGSALGQQGRYGEAAVAYRRETELNPGNGTVWFLLAVSLYGADENTQEAEDAARQAVRLDPTDGSFAHIAATILARRGKWPEASDLARRFLGDGTVDFHAEAWEDILRFCQEAVRTGHAKEAGELLDETNLGERWLPLREALRILESNNRLLLRRLAPEVREPTRRILDRLSPPTEATAAQPDSVPTKNKPHATREATNRGSAAQRRRTGAKAPVTTGRRRRPS